LGFYTQLLLAVQLPTSVLMGEPHVGPGL